jgi:drug/metabolite transporter (DMT)-like permease
MRRTPALLLMAGATVTWGATFSLVKLAVAETGPLTFLALRFVLATLILAPALLGRRLLVPRPPWIALCGLALFAGYACQTAGLVATTPARCAFITAVSVVLVPLLEPLLGVGRFSTRSASGAALAFAGLAAILRPETQAVSVGDLLTLGGALAFAFHGVLLQLAVRRAQPAVVNAVQVVTTAIVAIPFATAEGWRVVPSPRLGAALLVTSALATVGAFWAMAAAQRALSAAQTAVILAFEPVVAAAVSVTLGQERITLPLLAGGLLVVSGVLIATAKRPAAPAE